MSSHGAWSIGRWEIDAIGVDEIQYAKGHKYLTLVYQIDLGMHSAAVGRQGTDHRILPGLLHRDRGEVAAKIAFVCSDMWKPYLEVIREKCSEALHILDRFHIVAKMNKALDEVRAEEAKPHGARRLRAGLEEVALVLLKRQENLTANSSSGCAICSATTCRPFAPTCSRKTSSSSGITTPPLGLESFSTCGAAKSCAPASSR